MTDTLVNVNPDDAEVSVEKLPNIDLFILILDEECNNIVEKDEIFTQFKSDIKTICERERNRHNLYNVFINKKAFIEEYLLIFQMINKRNCELLKPFRALNFFMV